MRRTYVLAAAATAVLVAGCGASSGPAPVAAPPTERVFPPAPEPGAAPTPGTTPAGRLIPLPAGSAPEGLVVDPTTGLAVAALRNPARLALVDPTKPGAPVRTVPVPGAARHLMLGTGGGSVLVAGENTDTVAEVALPAGTVTRTTKVLRQPHEAVAVGNRIVVADEIAGAISILQDGRTVKVLTGPIQPGGGAAPGGPAGSRIGIVDVGGALLFTVDAATGKPVNVLKAGDGPTHAAPLGDGRIAVADTRGGALLIYDLTGTPRQVGSVPLSGKPYGITYDADRGQLWVTLTATNQLVRFDVPADGIPVKGPTFATVRQPNSVAVDARTGQVVVAGADGGTQSQLEVITP